MTATPGKPTQHTPDAKHYFTDEAGDPVLFSRAGKVLAGTPGCSRFFIVGFIIAGDPDALAQDLDALRARLLADPYFADVPSMQPGARKTAVAFHAKDDVPEVRREVFEILRRHDLRFLAIVRDKCEVMAGVRRLNRWNKEYRYKPNELYDDMVGRLFRDSLHKGDEVRIFFSLRGNRPRTQAFQKALDRARANFFRRWKIKGTASISIVPSAPAQCAGLQAADYFLWTLQRFYERGEDRFLRLLWPQFRLVMDIDDKREADYGVYYTQKKSLISGALKNRRGI